MSKIFKMPGSNVSANIGTFARQANGSVLLTVGDNVVLATAVASDLGGASNFSFFPLSVECRERLASVGKIPGGYLKREGKLSDSEVLLSRVVDRSIRPLFPDYFFDEVQVMITSLSYDGSYPSEVQYVLAASIALTISNIPFKSPVAAALLVREKSGTWKLNPDAETVKNGTDQVLVTGTDTGVFMIEANCDFATEEDLIALLNSDLLKNEFEKQISWQRELAREVGIEKRTNYELSKLNVDKQKQWKQVCREVLPTDYKDALFGTQKSNISKNISALKKDLFAKLVERAKSEELTETALHVVIDDLISELVPEILIEKQKRLDGRSFNEVRDISCIADLLPKSHGSAVFTRGQTQAIASLTLGAGADAQKIDTLLYGVNDKSFMLHYNFPPFATGEVKPLRGVGRREIGHGYLAEKSFKNVLPEFTKFPYTIRSLVDVLESNGSSSMATVCSTMLALMDAGVPTRKIISGIAMGMIENKQGEIAVLSDISGTEDAFGCMDFKVVGDEAGVVAIQIDVKAENGIKPEILAKALEQAKQGRLHILSKMKECLDKPRATLKDSAPRCFTFKIPNSKIGMVIGPSGKNIKQITADTNTQIDISDEGQIAIFASDAVSAKRAEGWIRALVGDIKNGSAYHGKVSKIADFGIFVSIVPGKDGLIHVSSMDRKKRDKLDSLYKVGDEIDVVVVSVDPEGKIKLTAPALEASDTFEDLG